jgi:lysophospholipase L1-like esterase/LysM repeat protein
LGCELSSANKAGINYHHLGVVGAQFSHFIKSANFNLEQMAYLKPDLIIFSFGTNEAYDSSFDSLSYFNCVSDFMKSIKEQMPEAAIVFTTAPDTRSVGRTPPYQTTVNNQLKKIAETHELSLFDLNTEMGGWGSLYKWYKNDLTLKDKLHFKQPGYALQGRLFTYALLSSYNQLFEKDQLDLVSLKDSITVYMQRILIQKTEQDSVRNFSVMNDSLSIKNNAIVPEIKKTENIEASTEANNIHIVKKGESIYIIGKKYKINYKSILKNNNLTEKSLIRPGMKLIIPKNK